MAFHITQGAILYIVVMVVVVVVGLQFIVGLDLMKLVRGEDFFADPEVTPTTGMENYVGVCSGGRFTGSILGLKVNYEGMEQNDVFLYPILDVGNNPLLDEGLTEIKCSFNSGTEAFDCGKVNLNFVLSAENIKSFNHLRTGQVPVQLYVFKKTLGIREFITAEDSLGRTTSELLNNFYDFYVTNFGLEASSTSCIAAGLEDYCNVLDENVCRRANQCYWSTLTTPKCEACPRVTKCEEYKTSFQCLQCGQDLNCQVFNIPGIVGGGPTCGKRL